MKCRISLLAVFSVLPLASIQSQRTVAAAAESAISDLPEVVVESKWLAEMRKDIIRAEDRFLALFNELNTDDDFDVHCTIDVPTGTRLTQRVCRAQFIETAQADWARAQFNGDYAPAPDLVALERSAEYKRKALAIINAHPELRRLVKARDALEKKYLATRKERLKGHWFAF